MRVAIHGKPFDEKYSSIIQEILRKLTENTVDILISAEFEDILSKKGLKFNGDVYSGDESTPDMILSLGGDGTLLEVLTHFYPNEIPILGINIGRLGYLASTSVENVDKAIEALLDESLVIENRAMLRLECEQDHFDGLNFALNDFTILKSESSSMITVNAFVDGEFLNTYWADGLIVSTPTGSTGYSLSCGGPIVMPDSNNFIITPVAPHNLTIRPTVISNESEIKLEIGGRSPQALISLDSRNTVVTTGTVLKIKKEGVKAKLAKVSGQSNFETLRQKLNWGLDARN